MEITEDDFLLVTGATGLIGSHVAERARNQGIRTRALVRNPDQTPLLDEWGVDKTPGEMTDAGSLRKAVEGVSLIVHCAAKVGDWGPAEAYRAVNVEGLENLLTAAEEAGTLKRFIHVSSLGVYEARDHFGTDESEAPNTKGIDGYTLSKVEAEQLLTKHAADKGLPATILRPGFVYGPRDRTILPRLLGRLKSGQFAYLGSGQQLMNNTFVGNLVDAVFAAIQRDPQPGEVYNIHDGRLVSKREFVATIAEQAGYEVPNRSVPLPVARFLARVMEGAWKLLGKDEAPLLSKARIKFLGLNLDFCIDKARRELGYEPRVDFAEGMKQTVDWFRSQQKL